MSTWNWFKVFYYIDSTHLFVDIKTVLIIYRISYNCRFFRGFSWDATELLTDFMQETNVACGTCKLLNEHS